MGVLSTVTISGNPYTIYGTLSDAKLYIAAEIGPGADAWALLTTDDQRGKMLVTAQRLLDNRIGYKGVKTVSTQAQSWPRSGVTDCEGATVDSATIPDKVCQAEYELAMALAADKTVATVNGTGSNVQSLTAGPVNITFQRATIDTDKDTVLPVAVLALLKCYTSDADDSPTAEASGFDGCRKSAFDDCAQYTLDGPLV